MNKELVNAIKTTKSVEELKDLAAKNGYVLTDEEASGYFDMYHTSGKIGENELDNVAGGLCRNGRQYSSDGKHNLIVTVGNHCDSYKEGKRFGAIGENCFHCEHSYFGTGFSTDTLYCEIRTFNNDPYNPAK